MRMFRSGVTIWTVVFAVFFSTQGSFDAGPVAGADAMPFCPTGQGRWTDISTVGAPALRTGQSAVWTGRELIVWGGREPDGYSNPELFGDGAAYDPAADTWRPISLEDAPAPREAHVATWTGTEMVIWGGRTLDYSDWLSDGAAYDPTEDRWRPISAVGAPPSGSTDRAIWTGVVMVVWSPPANRGARYNPATDRWTPMPDPPELSRRTLDAPVVWTGTDMLVLIDWDPELAAGGIRWDALSDSWSLIARDPSSPVYFSSGRLAWETAVWAGTTALLYKSPIWFEGPLDPPYLATYDPGTDRWDTLSTQAPGPNSTRRARWAAVWTGGELILGGGVLYPNCEGYVRQDDAYAFDPGTRDWRRITLGHFRRADLSLTWTGEDVLALGADIGPSYRAAPNPPPTLTGGKYRPNCR